MQRYHLSSSDFVQNDQGEDDAFMDPSDLARLKQLAGIAGISESATSNDAGAMSPVGSNTSITGNEKQQLEKENNIKPGSPEWFKLWFSRPYLTGEKPVEGKSTGNTLFSKPAKD